MAQQLAEFDTMKKKLMRDLQNRCEKVVELEISLDETREQVCKSDCLILYLTDQYNNVLKTNSSRGQQQKMTFLERSLEQLTNVQKQLVEQNTSLKKELSVADRKLSTRNERIQVLESMLQETQSRFEGMIKKYVLVCNCLARSNNCRYEGQMAAMLEKLKSQELKGTFSILNCLISLILQPSKSPIRGFIRLVLLNRYEEVKLKHQHQGQKKSELITIYS